MATQQVLRRLLADSFLQSKAADMEGGNTITVGLFVRIEAKPGKEVAIEKFLTGALPLVEAEPATTVWFALRLGPPTFGIFDAFPDESGRNAHLSGRVSSGSDVGRDRSAAR